MTRIASTSSELNQGAPKNNDVFISYSRKDKTFVESLDAALRKLGRDPWVDWDDIRKGEDWWESIKRGIAAADTFLFVVSPDSVASQVCRDEIEYAAKCNKRFLPIVRREGFDIQNVHPSISRHNWLFFRETDNLKTAFQELLQTLDTDLDYVSAHTRLLVRSLEWQTKGHDSSYLLRGRDLKEAGQWLTQSVNKEPRPTDSQVNYVEASLAARETMVRSRQKAKRLVILTTVIANLIFIALGLLAIDLSLVSYVKAEIDASMEQTLQTAVQGIDGDEFAELAKLPPGEQTTYLENPLYQNHQQWLATVQKLVPDAYPETYIQAEQPGQVEIIGDVYRSLKNGEGYDFRETIDAYGQNQIDGLQKTVTDYQPVYDEYIEDTFYLIYQPIKDANNRPVGALALQYTNDYVLDLRHHIGHVMRNACTIAAIWFIISSWLIVRATRLPHELTSTDKR